MPRPAIRTCCALLAAALLAAPAAWAVPVCIASVPALLERGVRIPVGCKLPDCCPGCRLDRPLDWRVTVAGEGVKGASLRFEGGAAPAREARAAGPGETLLEAVGAAQAAGTPAVGTLRLELDPAALAGWRKIAADPDHPQPLAELSVDVAQQLAGVVVNHVAFDWSVLGCAAPEPCDEIVETSNRGGDASVLLVDGRRKPVPGACLEDDVDRAAAVDPVGNLRPPDGCSSEVAILSEGDALALRENVTTWTPECGDQLEVALDPMLQMPATFYLAVPDAIALLDWLQTVDQVAKEDLDNAQQIYDENKTGIAFAATMRKLTADEASKLMALLPGLILTALQQGPDPVSFACAIPSQLEAEGLYVPDRLNVYYLPVFGTGMICPDDRNVVFVALNEKPATLPHEFGHALSLLGPWGHSNGVAGIDSHNVMWVKSSDLRDRVTLGQAFRMSLDASSVLNADGVRAGPTRSCPTDLSSPACPFLGLDWARP